ncbi:MAG TPA: hypothetical protein VFR37_15075, partial [Longimicrobium sp.]|nr:hypothetical protein [Longimicrobium sp.]
MPAIQETSGPTPERVRVERVVSPRRPPCNRVIENRTGFRIGICFKEEGARCMVLPPFGTRRVREAEQDRLQLDWWTTRGLVSVRSLAPRRHSRRWYPTFLGVGFWSIPAAAIAVAARPSWLERPALWAALAALWALILAAGAWLWRREPSGAARRKFVDHVLGIVQRWTGMALVLCIGVGVPGVLLWAQRQEIVSKGTEITALCQIFLVIFTTFVVIVATLPALLYFLFQRHRQGNARTTFFREVMRIDGSLLTVGDAEAVYGLAADEVYGEARNGRVLSLALVPVLISTLLMTFGWTAVLLPTLQETLARAENVQTMELAQLLVPRRTEFTFAFLGAYFFTLNMVFRRYVRADLGPKAYSHISMRIVVAVVLAWVAAAIPRMGGPDAAEPAAMLLVFAFFVGVVPETGMAVIHDTLRASWNPLKWVIPSLEEKDPLTGLEGITLYDRARLLEEGIENVENLAHHDLVELMLRTRIPTPRIVDLVDQAILYLHVRAAAGEKEDPQASLNALRRIGVRTATDLLEARRALRGEERKAFDAMLGSEQDVPRLYMVYLAIRDDEWMAQLRHWRDTRSRCERVLGREDVEALMHPG